MFSLYSQSGQKWSTGGNGISSGDFLGTTNNEPLLLKANNNLGLKIKPNGELIFKSLDLNSASGPNGIVFTDWQGKIGRINFTGNAGHILLGDGTWGTIPNTSNLWQETNGNISYTHGYVGVGTAFPVFPLDVIGDARISNNLYVGGGVVITDKVRATGDVKTARLEADTINMGASKAIIGETRVEGDTKLKYKLDVTGISNFNDEVYLNRNAAVNNDLTVGGNSNLNGNVKLQSGFTFDGTNGVRYTPDSNGGGKISYGKTSSPLPVNCAAAPWGAINHSFNGWMQIFDGTNPTTSGILNFQTWPIGSSIDASIGAQTSGGTALLLNYFCGNDVAICTGQYGGRVSMGKKVEIGMPYPPNANTALNIKGDVNFSGLNLSTNHTNDYNYNTALTVNRDGTKAFAIFNTLNTSGTENFLIWGSGKTIIGKRRLNTGPHTDAMLSVDGKIISTSVYVTQLNWADFVFNKDYKLPKLSEIENYYLKHGHLPLIPSEKEVQENGIDLGEMNKLLLQKIEELTILMVEQDKRIKELENKK